nr:hypothetical protein [Tanacetum cinerariifolium]
MMYKIEQCELQVGKRKGKGLLDPNGESSGKFKKGFGGNVGGCGGNGGKGGFIAERGGGLLAKRSMELKYGLDGSKFMANGEECLDGWVGAGGGEVKGGGVDFRVVIEDDREVTPVKGCRNNKDEH